MLYIFIWHCTVQSNDNIQFKIIWTIHRDKGRYKATLYMLLVHRCLSLSCKPHPYYFLKVPWWSHRIPTSESCHNFCFVAKYKKIKWGAVDNLCNVTLCMLGNTKQPWAGYLEINDYFVNNLLKCFNTSIDDWAKAYVLYLISK